jgi:hypothetical protein
MAVQSIILKPESSFSCLALVKNNSVVAQDWKLEKLTYCIYEYDKSSDSHEIRWGDGSWQQLEEKHFESLVLLPELDETTSEEIIPN